MNLDRAIWELNEERERVQAIIESLESMVRVGITNIGRPSRKSAKAVSVERRGRKSMDTAERNLVSQRMKLYWSRRREQLAGAQESARSRARSRGVPRALATTA